MSATIEHVKVFHVTDTFSILSFNIVNPSFQRSRDFYSNQTFMVFTVTSNRGRRFLYFATVMRENGIKRFKVLLDWLHLAAARVKH